MRWQIIMAKHDDRDHTDHDNDHNMLKRDDAHLLFPDPTGPSRRMFM